MTTVKKDISGVIIQLEHEARHAESIEALNFIICNSTRHLLSYHQCIIWQHSITGGVTVSSISGTGLINNDAPFVIWAQNIVKENLSKSQATTFHTLTANHFKPELAEQWKEWCPEFLLWCPLLSSEGELIGGALFNREQNWTPDEITLLQELFDAYSHAWNALHHQKKSRITQKIQSPELKKFLWPVTIFLGLCLLYPIRQSVLAPAEIVAKEPFVISPPIEGVVGDIFVEPNQTVTKDQALFTLDQTKFINQYRVAEKGLNVAEERFRKAGQHAFGSSDNKEDTSVLKAEMEKARAEMDFAKSLLDQIQIKSPADGIVIYSNKTDWIGKPVSVGEKVMQVANSNQKELDIWLPVSDAIQLEPGSDVKLFLNISPLSQIPAKIKYVSYSATQRPDNTLAYLVKAEFVEPTSERIGLQGTAKLYSTRVLLIYYLTWRPISAARRAIGF
jgi:hypothetical protein